MKTPWTIITLASLLLFSGRIHAQTAVAAPVRVVAPPGLRMFVEPSSTTVGLGKVRLIVGPLTHHKTGYVGDYQLKVVPYFFKSQQGALELEASDEAVAKLQRGVPVEFSGKATNEKNGKFRLLTGRATPSSNDHGDVIVSIPTLNGLMVFKTTYRLGP